MQNLNGTKNSCSFNLMLREKRWLKNTSALLKFQRCSSFLGFLFSQPSNLLSQTKFMINILLDLLNSSGSNSTENFTESIFLKGNLRFSTVSILFAPTFNSSKSNSLISVSSAKTLSFDFSASLNPTLKTIISKLRYLPILLASAFYMDKSGKLLIL